MIKPYYQFLFSDLGKRERLGSLLVLFIAAAGIVLPRIVEGRKPPTKVETIAAASLNGEENQFLSEDDTGVSEYLASPKQRKLHLRYATLQEMLQLGIEVGVASSLKQRYEQGERLQNIEELAAISGLDVELLKRRISLKSFKDYYKTDQKKQNWNNSDEEPIIKSAYKIVWVNNCDTSDLMALPGIGAKTAARLINYRNKLGGFLNFNQLKETFGVDTNTINKLKDYLKIDPLFVKKMSLVSVSYEQLSAHPYCRNYQAKALVNFRAQHGGLLTLADVQQIKAFTPLERLRLLPYLKE